MKIDVNSIRPVNQYKIAGQNTTAIKTDPSQKPDKVEISSEAKLFSDALREAKKDIKERIDQPRADLEEIKEKISEDEYGMESSALADKLLLDE